ncbi:MAG TPA: gliding motility-associated C-terminal domain-containing protein [Cyclobacteriaceae bacterium]|nr:gliding motility-associated C-terminal domain-containing protein [Cyclobacteriaceae bacterium]
MNVWCRRLFLPFIFAFCVGGNALATHLRAGEITATRVSCSGRTYLITVTVYIDTESGVHFGGPGEILHFGDSTFVEIPDTNTTPRPDLGENMGMAQFQIEHTYSGPGKFLLRYAEPFRNGGVLNLSDPLATLFYIETSIQIDPLVGCDNSPRLLVPPIDKACVGAAWYHNPGAYDVDGDSLSFEMIEPKMGKGVNVANYRDPNVREFYDRGGITYGTASEDGLHEPTFNIDAVTGTIVWDAPGMQGEYNIAFLIKEWRKLNGVWTLLGYVERDMQIVVEDCQNQRPELTVPEDICVEAGTLINEDIFGFDPDSDSVILDAYSELFIIDAAASVSPYPSVYQASGPGSPATMHFTWQTECTHVREQAYHVQFKITDKPKSGGARLVQFKTWRITVVGPAPEWQAAEIVPAKRSASLAWDPYSCTNATVMQVWRRVDQYPYTPPECVTGMPAFLGYTKIAEVPIGTSNFVDNNGGRGLAAGAQYCYRLVAVFPEPGGGESYLSRDTCLAPILADAPVITNVTVDRTAFDDGAITVKWREPFEIDTVQFPQPYTYEVYRAEGITGINRIVKPHPGRLSELSFVDNGINTEQLIYNYRIVVYDANQNSVDTSFAASSVRLEAKPQVGRIELSWFADVPWSNQVEAFPTHLVYRGPEGSAEDQMELIASVDATREGFHYVDEDGLDNTKTYCYRVMTQGAYGNPKIVEPLLNFSQKLCAQPNDTIPPCKPVVNIVAQSCEEREDFGCGVNIFTNIVKWNRTPSDCQDDIASYSIFISDVRGGDFIPYVDNVRDTFFIDSNENLKSFARCYKVQAVDRSGNKSELSDEFCFDNCPHYELPNVFTPNADGCNDVFTAFGDPDQSATCDANDDPFRCAKFVRHVDFIVYDRWGKELYQLRDSKERSIYIRWNGRDNSGSELPPGVYYYRADVQYYTVDPDKEFETLKGWVQLVRSKEE